MQASFALDVFPHATMTKNRETGKAEWMPEGRTPFAGAKNVLCVEYPAELIAVVR